MPDSRAQEIEESEVLDLLTTLVDKSLIFFHDSTGRYRLMETVRQYARERLADSDEAELLWNRHMRHFLSVAERFGAELYRDNEPERQQTLSVEYENIRAAMEWSFVNPLAVDIPLRFVGALSHFWGIGSSLSEAMSWTQRALATGRNAHPSVLARALEGGYFAAVVTGNSTSALELSREWIQCARNSGDDWNIAYALFGAAIGANDTADVAFAVGSAAEGMELARKIGDEWLIGRFLNVQGCAAWIAHDYLRARDLISESISISRKLRDEWHLAVLLSMLGGITRRLGNLQESQNLHNEGISLLKRHTDRRLLANHLVGVAGIAVATIDPIRAMRLLGASSALIELVDASYPKVIEQDAKETEDTVRTLLSKEACESAWAEGRRMTMEDAIRYALQELPYD